MSFSFTHRSANKDEALAKLEDANQVGNTPASVLDFVRSAVNDTNFDAKDVSVRVYGHLCDGSSYNVSTANIEVRPVEREVISPDQAAAAAQG